MQSGVTNERPSRTSRDTHIVGLWAASQEGTDGLGSQKPISNATMLCQAFLKPLLWLCAHQGKNCTASEAA
jgi:hypothetical protein